MPLVILTGIILPFIDNQWKSFTLVCMFLTLIPLFFLDLYKHWLPLRFTNVFWIAGILMSVMPYSSVSLFTAITASIISFSILHFIYMAIVKYHGYEALGRGDVHFISAFFSWLPATTALYCTGSAFLLMALFLYVNKGKELPYAPFIVLTVSAYEFFEFIYLLQVFS